MNVAVVDQGVSLGDGHRAAVPLMVLLLGLVFRGVAFECRFKANGEHGLPFLLTMALFTLGDAGLAIGL